MSKAVSIAQKQSTKQLPAKLAIRKAIEALEEGLAPDMEGKPFEEYVPHVEHFTDGLYARELFMPAGTVITSKIHNSNHMTFVMFGLAKVVDEFNGTQYIKGPCFFKTPRGMKRALYIMEDSLWVTVHATAATDSKSAEEDLISPTHIDLLESQE